jgi:hypothetical protein
MKAPSESQEAPKAAGKEICITCSSRGDCLGDQTQIVIVRVGEQHWRFYDSNTTKL